MSDEEKQKELWQKHFRIAGITIGAQALIARDDELLPGLFVDANICALSASLIGLGFTAEQVRDLLTRSVNNSMKPTNVLWRQVREWKPS